MKKNHKTACSVLAILLLAAALLGACTNSGKTDEVGFFQLKPEGGAGSIDITVKYAAKEETVSMVLFNNTAYKITIDDPAILYQKTNGEMYEALYPPVSGGDIHVYAGAEVCINPGETRAVDVLPHPLKLTEGEYRIDLVSLKLINPETEEESDFNLTRYMYFSIGSDQ